MSKKRKPSEKKLYYPHNNYRRALKTIKLLAEKSPLSIKSIAGEIGSDSFTKGTKILVERLIDLRYCEEFGIITNEEEFGTITKKDEFGIITNKKHSCKNCKKSIRFLARVEDLYPFPEWAALQKNEKLGNKPLKESHIIRRIQVECLACQNRFLTSKEIEYKVYQIRMIKLSENGRFAVMPFLERKPLYNFISKHKETKLMDLIYALEYSQKKAEVKILLEKIKNNVLQNPDVTNIVHAWHSQMRKKVMSMRGFQVTEQPLIDYMKRQRTVLNR